MSIEKPFANNTLATYVYEPFSYTISNPGSYTLTTSNTPGIPPGYIVNNGTEVVFATSSNGMNTGTESFTITAKTGDTIVGTSVNTVTIGSGRFLDLSGNSYAGSNFAFYKNEPITPIPLVAPFEISVPTSVPTLPPGLTYISNASNIYTIEGTPLVTVPQSNYLVIGKATGSNLGKIVTSQFGMSVSNERVVMNLTGSPIVSPMIVGTPISQHVITAQYPPYPSGGTLRYSWFGLPDGITVTDISGTPQGSTFIPSDPLSTLIFQGTPTVAAANAFKAAGITSNIVTFTATRLNPLPQISNTIPITFRFGETVLFDSVTVPTLYSGVALDPSAISFRAQTYFGTGSAITNIFSPDLRADLSINFVPAEGRGYLFSPTTPGGPIGTNSYTIRAINSSLISRDLLVPITVATDTMSFVSPTPNPVDASYNFVLSRPISSELAGYYTSNIQFRAVAASGNAVVFSASGLAGTGLSLSNVNSNTVQLVGIPDTLTPLTTATVTASTAGTPATASTTFKFAILADDISFSQPSSAALSFVQNRVITPIQLTATTLSERQVISFTSSNMPTGLTLSTTGLITGAPADSAVPSGTFSVAASTGYTTQTQVYTYTAIADNILILIPTTTVTAPQTFSNVEFDVVAYSGATGNLISYFGASGLVPYQSPSATLSVTPPNFLSGDFSTAVSLAKQYRFQITGQAGTLIGGKQVNIDIGNVSNWHIALTMTSIVRPDPIGITPVIPTIAGAINVSTEEPVTFMDAFGYTAAATGPAFAIGPGQSNATTTYSFEVQGNGFDITRSSNVVVAVLGSNMIRSTDYGVTWKNVGIEFPVGTSGPQWSGYSNALDVGPTRARLANPIFGSVATDGSSNWYAVGCATRDSLDGYIWYPTSILATSSDDGVTWSVVDIGKVSSIDGFNDKLIYNQGRLFATNAVGPISLEFSLTGLYYADVSSPLLWTAPALGLFSVGGVASSNSTLFAVGLMDDDPYPLAQTAISTDNGDTWAVGSNVVTTDIDNTQYMDIVYRNNKWLVSGQNNGFVMFRWSSNLTSWSNLLPEGATPGSYSAVANNGLSAVASYSGGSGSDWWGSLFDVSGNLVLGQFIPVSPNLFGYTKKLLPANIVNGEPTLTFSIPYDDLGITFTSPTQTQFTNWQFVPIPTIPVVATTAVPGSFIYYYAAGLPRGLSLVLDASGIEASITGTSSQYSDAYRSVVLYAALDVSGGEGSVAAKQITMRTVLPTAERQQTSAGAWTSLVRQYTVVNAAQNSLNGRTLPATEPPLGEFTRPHPPDAVNDPTCKKC